VKPKTIVAVLESSSAANDVALTRASSLARWYESELHVVHVGAWDRAGRSGGDTVRDALVERITLAAVGSGTGDVNVVPALLSGSPVDAIADYADRVAADLVVVGKEARHASGYWATGSFAAALGKAVKAPTFAVPAGHVRPADPALFRNVLVPIDFSDASLRALSAALNLAQQSGGQLRLLHVLDRFGAETVYSGARAFRLMADFRARVARSNRELQALIPPEALNWSDIDVATVSGVPGDAIVAAASERRADLIVLGLPRRTLMAELVSGSTAHRVLRRTTSPVLLVPGPAHVPQTHWLRARSYEGVPRVHGSITM